MLIFLHRNGVREDLDKERAELQAMHQENAQMKKEIDREIVALKKEVDVKIQKAVDNPLANK